MFARTIKVPAPAGATVEDDVIDDLIGLSPLLASLHGFGGAQLLVDRERDMLVLNSLWQTEADLGAGAPRWRAVGEAAALLMGRRPQDVVEETYEVVGTTPASTREADLVVAGMA
jgi:hypothetical protein